MLPVDKFTVPDESGNYALIVNVSPAAASLHGETDDTEKTDYLVRVRWLKTVDPKQAIHEKGFFGNQNSVARSRARFNLLESWFWNESR
jgi:hypothetical protein